MAHTVPSPHDAEEAMKPTLGACVASGLLDPEIYRTHNEQLLVDALTKALELLGVRS